MPVISGSGINTLLTMIGSVERGHDVALLCGSEGPLCDEVRESGIAIHIVPQLGQDLHAFKDSIAVPVLARLMRQQRFDLVHTHNSKAGFVGRLSARLAGIPLVIHTVHGFAFHDAESPVRRALFKRLERLAAGWCDGMIFISPPLQEWAASERIGLDVPRAVIYSGIDIEAFRSGERSSVRREFGVGDDQLAVGIISKLWEGKGHAVLFRAWKNLLDRDGKGIKPVLLVVGAGPLDLELRQLASELQIADSVIFTGFRTDIPNIASALDFAVLPSKFEGMGRVVLEAMACGKPVIASRVGGIPDLVKDRINGILVPPDDPAALEAAMAELVFNADLRKALSEGASRSVLREHSAPAMVEQIHAFYDAVAANKRKRRTAVSI
jgi:glycosyltransferase involved in cell wall biosynthesis